MSLPKDIQTQTHIEQGINAVNTFTYTHNNVQHSIKWSPISYNIAKITFYKAMLDVPEEYREWLGSRKKRREEKKLIKPPPEAILIFNFQHAVHSIHYAVQMHYPNITIQEIERLNFNLEDLHDEIAVASGLTDGQTTVESFPADEPTQDTESET